MRDILLEFIRGFDIQNIITMVIIVWYFSKKITEKVDNLDKDIREMNSRVSRIEGTVYGRKTYEELGKQ